MTANIVDARPNLSYVWLHSVLAVLLLAAAAAMRQPQLALAAVLPGLSAALLWRAAPTPVRLQLGDSAMVVNGESTIPYASIERVLVDGRPYRPSQPLSAASRVQIEHASGVLLLPPRLSVRVSQLNEFLEQRVAPQPPPDPPAALASYLATQREKFGDQVQVIHSRPALER